jgi:hypothetical protein
VIIHNNGYTNFLIGKYHKINKFVNDYVTYRFYFNTFESLYLTFFSMKRHHAKIIRQKIYELSHDEYGNILEEMPNSKINVFDVVDELYRTMPIKQIFSGLEHINGYKLTTGHNLEICFNRASIANMANVLDLCTATRRDLVEDQRLGKMLRINVKNKKEIVANVCVHAEELIKDPSVKNKGFYILSKNHKYWDEQNNGEIYNEIKNHLNEYLKIHDTNIAIP